MAAEAAFLLLAMGGACHAATATPDSYSINIGDELEMDILDDSDPPQRYSVGSDGQVQLPLIGGVSVENITLGQARDLIRRTYVEREIFVAPTVELSVANFRPIFVLGDVRNPGNYDFQPFLTAEQAVGLAGGPAISTRNEEARVLERRNLQGALNGLDSDLARLVSQYARLQAQVSGRTEVRWADVPAEVRPDIDRELFDALKPKEDQIITLEERNRATRRRLIEEAVTEASNRIALIDQRETVQSQALERIRSELDRNRVLVTRGLKTQSAVTQYDQAVSRQEGELLQLREQRSAALVQLGELQSELSQIDTEWEKQLLSQSQAHWSEINKLRSQRTSLEDRLLLLEQWMNAATGTEAELLVEYRVRRRGRGGLQQMQLDPLDELAPGDLLVVVVKPPEALAEAEPTQ
ncbi:polysaccharide biosynthesis/export family protein [Actibacterium sp. MT2.3-13A]|uniref:polysaccharide biosynthesis/export family protein n=1 Tax=Actibacterium sp. MT2.3-13A TaxID=2828332 RepID=UPI001BAD9CFA